MSNATNTATWTPTAGKRAWWSDSNVTVRRVYKGGTCTIQYWGRGCLEGKLVNHRGISVKHLAPPRIMGDLDPVTGKRIWLVAS